MFGYFKNKRLAAEKAAREAKAAHMLSRARDRNRRIDAEAQVEKIKGQIEAFNEAAKGTGPKSAATRLAQAFIKGLEVDLAAAERKLEWIVATSDELD